MANRRPIKRLKSALFPTLGRPTMAMVAGCSTAVHFSPRANETHVPSIYIETFGCQMNEADSRHIAERAISAGYRVASAPEEANVVVLNTCTVRDNAERRAYGRMNHLNALKRLDPNLRLVVTGCLAEQDRDRMKRLAPHVDAVFGTRELEEL